MSKDSLIKRQETPIRVVCTFVFTLFSFFYLYYFQSDVLTVLQHVFSKGQTHYDHFVGATLITLVLLLLQVGVVNICRKVQMAWAFTFVPSALCLAALTDVEPSDVDGMLHFSSGVYLLPIGLIVFGLLVWTAKATGLLQSLSFTVRSTQRLLWYNLLVLLLCMLFVCTCGNGSKVYHARAHAEQCIMDGRVDEALLAIENCGSGDENLTMLTAYALAQKNALAERLFEFPVKGGSEALTPYAKNMKFELIADSVFYSKLGGWYVQRMPTMKYLDYQRRHGRMNSMAIDYLLCGYLLDRNIDAFAANVTKYYEVNDSVALPKHYKEALVMYTHLRSTPRVIYNNNVMNTDFEDFQKLEKSVADERERQTALRDTYGNTYWYYYQYK